MNTTKIWADFQLMAHTINTINIKNDFFTVDSNEKLKRTFELNHRIMELSEDADGDHFAGALELTTIANVSSGKQKYKAKIVMRGFFFGRKEKMNIDEFREMLNINGIAALYSIARSTLISISAQTLDRGAITLPMINVHQYSRNLTEEQLSTPKEGD